ncbi:hypothetical protein [Aureibacter tunicatorum]|uniref:Uncharacterized protein n=1 Tax=Aureibacter tunicatorum TaxID=866807 RepID=A0AAE3XTT7_9BACT|nr:hypothetical protein [Aureibacter tunicatorum]MDR6241860.1 hypothetical protein [Aureibacter tunicatorum]BDD07107.1 hypothetical protein AUTU_45900 [Aureibacter tunicatorum]
MEIINGIVNVDGTISSGKNFEVKAVKKGDRTTYEISLTNGDEIKDYAVVCQQGPASGGAPLTTGLRGINLLEVNSWTKGINPLLPAFNFIAVKLS